MAIWGNRIGSYIHLHYKNYIRYGLAPRGNVYAGGQGQQYGLSKYLDELKDEIKRTKFSQTSIEPYEDMLNQIFSRSAVGNKYAAQAADIQNEVVAYLQTLVPNIDIDAINWQRFTIKPSAIAKVTSSVNIPQKYRDEKNNEIDFLAASTLKHSRRGQGKKININHMVEQFKQIQLLVTQITDSTTLQKLGEIAETINERLSTLAKQGKMADAEMVKSIPVLTIKKKKKETKELNLIEALNYYGRQVLRGERLSQLEGLMAEVIVAAIYKNILQLTDTSITEMLGDLDEATNIYDSNQFGKQVDLSKILSSKHWRKQDATGIWELKHNTKGKIDIYGSVNSLDEAGMSVKSYNLNPKTQIQDIGLVAGTNLLYLMQNRAQFFNHYLNQTVASRYGSDNSIGPPQSVIQNANEVMKKMLILLSFVGGGKRNIARQNIFAKIFIINDKATGKKRIIDIGEQAQKIISTSNILQSFDVQGISAGTTWLNKYIPNPTNDTSERINNLLALTHKQKISVSLKKTAIQYF